MNKLAEFDPSVPLLNLTDLKRQKFDSFLEFNAAVAMKF